jgi:hypothetical protein
MRPVTTCADVTPNCKRVAIVLSTGRLLHFSATENETVLNKNFI